jgi:hypothetical protein
MRDNRESESIEIDDSDLQSEKHPSHRISTEPGE